MGNSPHSSHVEGFALGRLVEPLTFNLRSAGPQEGQYDPRPRYPDGTLVQSGFKTGTNRGRPTGTALGIGHTAQTKAQIVERYKAGEGLQVLAAAFSTTAQRVREIVVQAGVTIRPFGQQRKNEQRSDDVAKLDKNAVSEILLMHSEGKPIAEIAARFGITESGAYYHIARRNRGLKDEPAQTMVLSAQATVTEAGNDAVIGAATFLEETPAPAKPKRQIPPKRDDVTEEMVRGWVVANKRDGVSPHSLAQGHNFSSGLILGRIRSYILKHPNYREEMGIATPPDPAMDDPTPDAAAKTQTEPATELMWKQIQARARELRERVIADTRVIAVQELPSPVLARKPYHVPRILESGSMLDVMNPHAAAKLVEGLVSRLNEVPGVQAYFEWRASGSVGQPLGR